MIISNQVSIRVNNVSICERFCENIIFRIIKLVEGAEVIVDRAIQRISVFLLHNNNTTITKICRSRENPLD